MSSFLQVANQSKIHGAFANHFGRRTPPLIELFHQRPALNAVIGMPGSDTTSPTAAALLAYTVANKNFEVLGTNMTTALCTFADGGGILLTTAGAAADSAIVLPHLDTNQSTWAATKWNTNDRVGWATRVKTAASIGCTVWAGLKKTNTPVFTTDTDQAFFRYSDAHASYPTKLLACYSVNNTDYELDTGIVMAVSTSYTLEIFIDQFRIPHFFVGVGEEQTTLRTSGPVAMTSDVDLIPYAGVLANSATAAKALTVRGIAIQKDDND